MNHEGIVKRGNKFAVVVELGIDPATGKRRKKWHSGFRTIKEAKAARVALLSQLANQTYVEPSKVTLAVYLDEWLRVIEPTVKPSTHYSYDRNMRLHVLPSLGSTLLAHVDAMKLNALYAELLLSGKKNGTDGGLSPRSVSYIHTILRRALKDAVRWGRLTRNPADLADPPKKSATLRPPMTTWEADTVREFMSRSESYGDRHFAAWFTYATTGMRRGEALGLRWSDLELVAGAAYVSQTLICVNHKLTFSTPKTSAGKRRIELDRATVAVLKDHRRRQLEDRLLVGEAWQDHDLVFAKGDGSPLHPEGFSREFDRRVRRWGLPKITLHGLRHTWATLALQADVHPRVVQERLGHSHVGVTLAIYSHVTPTMQADAAERVAQLFASGR
jgi:integrase